MNTLVATQRAQIVSQKASEARTQHGNVWHVALKVEAQGALSDTLSGTYIHAGCPMGFPVWALASNPKLRPPPMPDSIDATVFLSYNVTADPGEMTWCFTDKPTSAPGMNPSSDEHRQIFAYTNQDQGVPRGSMSWTGRDSGSSFNINIDIVPHPEHQDKDLQYGPDWAINLPQQAQELLDMCENYKAQANALLALENRHNVADMVAESLAPPKHVDVTCSTVPHLLQSVQEYYNTMRVEGNGVPQDMVVLGPVSQFRIAALDADPQSLHNGFEHTLFNFEPADADFKDDWASLVRETLRKAATIQRKTTKTLGFARVDELCTTILHNHTGYCDLSRCEFFDAQDQFEAELRPKMDALKTAQEALKSCEERAMELSKLEALCHDRNAISGRSEVEAIDLRNLLAKEGLEVEPRGEDGDWHKAAVEKVAKEFRKDVVGSLLACDENLDEMSKRLVKALNDVVEILLRRITKMEGIQNEVFKRKEAVLRETETLRMQCLDKKRATTKTVVATVKNIKTLQKRRKKADEARHQQREQFQQSATSIQAENVRLDEQIKTLLAQMQGNEAKLRALKAEDREQEDVYQQFCAADNQKLGTMAGCLDEMQNFEKMLQESADIVLSVGNTATSFLTDDGKSIANLIQKDIERGEMQQREYDTDHHIEFCAWWKRNHRDELNAQSDQINIESEIEKIMSKLRLATQQRSTGRVNILNEQVDSLEQQKDAADEKVAKIQEAKAEAKFQFMPVVERLGNGYSNFEESFKTICAVDDDKIARDALSQAKGSLEHAIHSYMTTVGDGSGATAAAQQGHKLAMAVDRRKLDSSRQTDKPLIAKIQNTCKRPKLQARWLPPADPTDELENRVLIDTGRLVRQMEEAEAEIADTAEERRKAMQAALLGKTYLQIEDDDGALSRAPSRPGADAYAHTHAAQQAQNIMSSQVPEGTPPASAGGFFDRVLPGRR